MKYNVRDIKGLFTNSDSSDTSLEFIRDSHNFKYEIGYAQTESFKDVEDHSYAGKIEAYEYCYLSDDKIRKRVPDGLLREALVVVCIDGTKRIIYANQEVIHIEADSQDGAVLIDNSDGVVKIFTPDGNYWYGIYWDWKAKEEKLLIEKLFNVEGLKITASAHVPAKTQVGGNETVNLAFEVIEVYEVAGIPATPPIRDETTIHPIKVNIKDADNGDVLIADVWLHVFNETTASDFQTLKGNLDVWRFYENYDTPENLYRTLEEEGIQYSVAVIQIEVNAFWTRPIIQPIYQNYLNQVPMATNISIINATTGFSANRSHWLITAILDGENEIVVGDVHKLVKPSGDPKYAHYGVRFNFGYDVNLSPRVTGMVLYGKELKEKRDGSEKDFEEAYRIDFLKDDFLPGNDQSETVLKQSLNGVLLTQNIGFFYDKRTYKLVESFSDYKVIDGVAYAISGNGVHVCALGGGRIMKGVFYSNSTIPLGSIVNPLKLANVNGIPAVYSREKLKLFAVTGEDGIFIYQGGDSYELGINNQYQFVETSEGIIQITANGVITLRDEQNSISTAINDQIIKDWETSSIFYNERLKHLYVFNENYLLRVKYQNGYWEKFYGDFGDRIMRQNFKGETVYAKDNKIITLIANKASDAYLEFQETDFGEKNIYFVILRVYLDIELLSERTVPGRMLLESQGHTYEVPIADEGPKREVFEVVIPLLKDGLPRRVGDDSIKMKLIVENMDIKFYNKEVEYDVITKN